MRDRSGLVRLEPGARYCACRPFSEAGRPDPEGVVGARAEVLPPDHVRQLDQLGVVKVAVERTEQLIADVLRVLVIATA